MKWSLTFGNKEKVTLSVRLASRRFAQSFFDDKVPYNVSPLKFGIVSEGRTSLFQHRAGVVQGANSV